MANYFLLYKRAMAKSQKKPLKTRMFVLKLEYLFVLSEHTFGEIMNEI